MLRDLRSRIPGAALVLWACVFCLSVVLPSSWTGLFASPDETAVAVSVQRIEVSGSAGISEPLARALPWLHPRSYLASGDGLVPVGFLGWPWWLAQLARGISLNVLAVVASLVAASGVIPWYLILRRRFGATAAWWGTALAWSFPAVLLYVNRSFFSHMPQLTAGFWALWVLVRAGDSLSSQENHGVKKIFTQVLSGFLFGVAVSFRPIELFWMLPVFLLIWTHLVPRIAWKKHGFMGVGMLLGLLPLCVVQAQTYGSWFQVGYWVAANSDPAAVIIPQLVAQQAKPWFMAIAPYGLHPRTVLWNVRWFFLSFLLPWVFVGGLVTLALVIRQARTIRTALPAWIRAHFLTMSVLGFFIGWILLIYGSGFYLDHVRPGSVTVGNSFLRYTLPFGFAFAWFMAWLATKLSLAPKPLRVAYGLASFILIVCGLYGAFIRDEEGILATRGELVRYKTIREAAAKTFIASDIILSERSDKIFFPVVRAVSPLPSEQQLQALAAQSTTTAVGLFARPLSLRERDAWRRMGYDVSELGIFGRERLYRLTPFLR